MNRTQKLILAAASLMLAGTTLAAHAFPIRAWSPPPQRVRRQPVQSFTFAGRFNGVFDGQVSIDGRGFTIKPNLQAYVVGSGLVPMSWVPIGSRVTVSGRGTADAGTIVSITVRPADEEKADGTDMAPFVHLQRADASR